MTPIQYVGGALLLVAAVILVLVVLSQHGRQAGLTGTIQGGAETFLDKNRGRSVDALLKKLTKFFAIGFALLMLVMNIVVHLLGW